MKKTLLFFKLLLLVAFVATWTSCSKSDDIEASDPKPVTPTPTNPTDKTDPKDDPYMVVCEHVEQVAKSVDTYYDQCHSMDELKRHLDDIKKIEYVEDVYATNTTMFVKIKDYGKIAYSFFPESTEKTHSNFAKQSIKNLLPRKAAYKNILDNPTLGNKKIAFVVQQQNDENWTIGTEHAEELRKLLKDYGFDVSPTIIAPSVSFFQNEIFNYDFVYIVTHGGYDPGDKEHILLTSEQPNKDNTNIDDNHELTKEDLYYYKGIPTDKVFWYKHTERRKGKDISLWYAVVTEKWIADSPNSFEKKGKAIVFNCACETVQGPDLSTKDSISYGLAKIFTEKLGAGAYLGYDQSNNVGKYSGLLFLRNLLAGMSIDESYNTLPFDCLHEYHPSNSYWADLIIYHNPLYPDIGKSRLWSPFVDLSPEDKSTEEELRWTLSQWIYYFVPDDNCTSIVNVYDKAILDYSVNLINPYSSQALYGFFISETGNIEDAKMVNAESIGSDNCFFTNKYKLNLEYTLTYKPLTLGCLIAPETTYYYWAYFFDGKNYHLSERHSFTTGSLKGAGSSNTNVSGQGNLPNVPGSDL